MHWVLALMLFLQPNAPWDVTYQDTARAIAQVVDEEAPLFDDDAGKDRTTVLLVAVAYRESRFDPRAVGDGGRARGLWQQHGGAALFDPATAARRAVRALRTSMGACAARPLDERLAAYASGSCSRGGSASRERMALADRLLFVPEVSP